MPRPMPRLAPVTGGRWLVSGGGVVGGGAVEWLLAITFPDGDTLVSGLMDAGDALLLGLAAAGGMVG